MALVKNIAGFDQVGVIPMPVTTPAEKPGLFSGIVKLGDMASGFVPGIQAASAALKIGINLLPPGALKTKLTEAFKGGLIKGIINLFKGRVYTTGQYKLGEGYIDQIQGGNVGYRDVTDETVPEAIMTFTILFGVRITTVEDLDALQAGAMAYSARPDKGDISTAAVQRAVYLKQTFFPDSSYNTRVWDIETFGSYPLAAPIPDPMNVGQLYSGPLPGGGQATDGIILINEKPGSANSGSSGLPDGSKNNNNLLLLGGAAVLLFMFWPKNKNS